MTRSAGLSVLLLPRPPTSGQDHESAARAAHHTPRSCVHGDSALSEPSKRPASAHTLTHTHTHTYGAHHKHTHRHAHTHAHTDKELTTNTHKHALMQVHTHTHTLTHIYIQTHTHPNTHYCTNMQSYRIHSHTGILNMCKHAQSNRTLFFTNTHSLSHTDTHTYIANVQTHSLTDCPLSVKHTGMHQHAQPKYTHWHTLTQMTQYYTLKYAKMQIVLQQTSPVILCTS